MALKVALIANLRDVYSGKYSFVCAENTILCTLLRRAGVPESSIVTGAHIEHKQMIEMVFRNRVDFLLVSDQGSDYYANLMSYEKSKLQALDNYKFEVIEYLADRADLDKSLIK